MDKVNTINNFDYSIISETPCQKRKKGNQGSRHNERKYKDLFCAFDIETTNDLSINQAYIYRCFEDKEDMLKKTFEELDDELVAKALQHVEVMYMQEMEFELRCRFYFSAVWKCLLEDRDGCLTYMRYFYSPYFTKYSAEDHKKRFELLLDKFSPAFKDEADVWMILNHILNVMLDFAVKVHNDQMPKEDNYAEHVFRVIYQSVKQYFRNNEESDS